jgi:hypothetical protein
MISKGIGRKSPKKAKDSAAVKAYKSKVLNTDNFDQILERENNDLKYDAGLNDKNISGKKKTLKNSGSMKPKGGSPKKPNIENRWLKEENSKLK